MASYVQRRHFFVRDMVEEFEISVPFVRTDDNIAEFYAMRALIMNERSPANPAPCAAGGRPRA